MADQMKFRFRYVTEDGQLEGGRGRKGQLGGGALTLHDTVIPLVNVTYSRRRLNRIALTLVVDNGELATVALAVPRNVARKLHQAINVGCSSARADARLTELKAQGRQHDFRSRECPYCGATMDLTDWPTTPQVHCDYCETVVTVNSPHPPNDESGYRLCGQCGYYARPRKFTRVVIMAVPGLFGWSSREYTLCNVCMRKEAWKMLLMNLLFVIGIPLAVFQLLRAYLGGSFLSRWLAGLDTANALARRGKADRALELYDRILHRLSCGAGVRYDCGLALLKVDRPAEAASHFQAALKDCANYPPAYEALCGCLDRLGRSAELRTLQEGWRYPPVLADRQIAWRTT